MRRVTMFRLLHTTVALLAAASAVYASPLTNYVESPDNSYAWRVTSTSTGSGGVTTANIDLTSQTWHAIKWQHHLTVVKPANMPPDPVVFLFITGDYNQMEASTLAAALLPLMRGPIAILHDIPNQPLFDGKREDALIAYTFLQYLDTGDPTWPLLFPMTKAAVRAMDAIQAYAKSEWKTNVSGFVVGGASKRGWTTWLTGCVDKRVRGIVPMVYNNLNLPAQMKLQVDSFGTYSEEIADYSSQGLTQLVESEKGRALSTMVDPYTYRSQLTMPKLLVNGTNDRYWPLTAADLYYDALPTPKYLLYAPNSGHGLEDRTRVVSTVAAFYRRCVAGKMMPKLACRFNSGGGAVRLTIASDEEPTEVLIWSATSPTKDFRDAKWTSAKATLENGRYVGAVQWPDKGYVVCFAEARYSDRVGPFYVSSPIRMVAVR
jgi:PhoPQ-activated pathogenicity-related protein